MSAYANRTPARDHDPVLEFEDDGHPTIKRLGPQPAPRRWIPRGVGWWLAAIVVVSTLSALIMSYRVQPTYGARAEILFDLGGVDQQQGDRRLQTAARLGRSRPVIAAVAGSMNMDLDDVEAALSFSPAGSTAVLEVTAEASDWQTALRMVELTAQQLITLVPEAGELPALETLRQQAAELNTAEAELESRLRELEAARASATPVVTTPSADERVVEAELRQIINQRGQLEARLTALEVEQARTSPPQLLGQYALDDPLSPNRLRLTLVGAIFGAGVAGLVAVLVWWRRHAL